MFLLKSNRMKKSIVLMLVLGFSILMSCKDKENNPVVPPTATVNYKLTPTNVGSFRLTYTGVDGSEVVVNDNSGLSFSKDISVNLPFTAKATVVAYRKNAADPVACDVVISSGQSFYQQSQTITADSVKVEVSGSFQ